MVQRHVGKIIDGSAKWSTVDVTVCKHPIEQGLFLGLEGEVLCVGSQDVHWETICKGQTDSPKNRGMMRGLATIDGKAYAVGMQRQVYRRDECDAWTCIDATARPESGDTNVYSFEAITGFGADEIYAVGRGGEIWQWSGTRWAQHISPTQMILTRACCAADGKVYVVGRRGTLVRGRNNRWELIEQDVTEDDFWGLTWFDGSLYAATQRGIFKLEGKKLVRVDFGLDQPTSFFALSAADGVMWSIGPKDVMAFDGKQWTRID